MHALSPGRSAGGALEQVQRRARPLPAPGAARPRSTGVARRPSLTVEQLRGLVVPALLDPQVGQSDQAPALSGAAAERPQATASVSAASASGQRPAAVRMPP